MTYEEVQRSQKIPIEGSDHPVDTVITEKA